MRRTGKLAWTFYTIPGPGEVGHDTWPQRQRHVEARRRGRLADAGRRSRARARLLLDGQSRPGSQRLGAARRQPVQRLDGRDRGEEAAITAGTSSKCITTSGITTRRIPSCCSTQCTTARCARASRRSARQDGSTSSTARRASRSSASRSAPVPQEPRQATAATQPYPARRRSRAARDRHRARGLQAREQRPHLHAVLGRAAWS